MEASMAFYALALLLSIRSVHGRQAFVALIPNGDGVSGVSALGHTNEVGGGSLNIFGEAFEDAGREWTAALCQADSDADGATNGEELGDPCCTWTSAGGFDSSPPSAQPPTHPGEVNTFTAAELAAMACGESNADSVGAPSAAANSMNGSTSGSSDGDTSDSDLPRLPSPPMLELPPSSPPSASTSGSARPASPKLAVGVGLAALAAMACP